MRDLLEKQIFSDYESGDTTILAELLTKLDDKYIIGALSDSNQAKIRYYYEIHVTGKEGFSTSVVSKTPLDENEVILLAYKEDKLQGDDADYIDYVEELTSSEWNEMFN